MGYNLTQKAPPAILGVSVMLLDQLTKHQVQLEMALGESIPVISGVFHITYILNPGAAFGILENQTGFFILVALVLLLGTLYLYPRIPAEQSLLRWGTGLLSGGAVGNLIDRIRFGQVIDFFDFRIWPVFNVADIAIVCGVTLMMYSLLFVADGATDRRGGNSDG